MTWADIGVVASGILAVAAVVGLLVRFVLMPYLIDQVVRPVRETHRQVTPHKRDEEAAPTVVDRLDDMKDSIDEVVESLGDLSKKARQNRNLAVAAGHAAEVVARRLSEHEAWSREEDHRLWTSVRALENKQKGKS